MIFEESSIILEHTEDVTIHWYRCNVSGLKNVRKHSYSFYNQLNDEKYDPFWGSIIRAIRRFEFNSHIYPIISDVGHVLQIH